MGEELNPAPAVVPAPTAGASAPAPAAPIAAPVEAPAAPPPAPSAPATAPADQVTSLISDTPAPSTEAQPAPEQQAPAPEAVPAEAPSRPTYDAFKLPEGIEIAQDRLADFTNDLADYELGAKDHASTQALGQKLLDRHIQLVNEAVTAAVKNAKDTEQAGYQEKINKWTEATKSDPQIGGNRLETTKADALKFIRMHGGTPAQQQEVLNALKETAAGVHPAMIRLLAQAGRNMSEPKPLAATKPAPNGAKDKIAKRYGGTQQ